MLAQIKKYSILILLLIAGIIFTNSLTFKTGQVYDFGIGFWGPLGHDGIWHQALVSELTKNIPPQNPTFSGMSLKGYHYYYDLLVALIHKITLLPISLLIYQILPIIFSLLLGLGTYWLVRKLFKNQLAAYFSVFFVYFGSSFGWVVEYIRERHWGGESAFWVNQPVSLNLNPPFALSLVLMVFWLLLFNEYLKKPELKLALPIVFIAGVMVGIKVYAGVLMLGGLGLLALIEMIKTQKYNLLLIFLNSLLLSLWVFWPNLQNSSSLLQFSPFWFIHSMIDFADRVGWAKLSSARMSYFSGKQWPKFFLAEALGLFIFVVGNLGTRIIAFFPFQIPGKIKRIPQEIKTDTKGLILVMAGAAFLIPLLLVQKGNTWNTIQFMYYWLFFLALFAGNALAKLKEKIPSPIYFFCVSAIVLITPISSWATFKSAFSLRSPTYLPPAEQEALEFLKAREDGVVLTPPFDKKLRANFTDPYPLLVYETTAYVPAYSAKPAYLVDLIQQEILQIDFEPRLELQKKFFIEKDLKRSTQFLKENQIRYLYLPNLYALPMAEEEYPLNKIFENNSVKIYEVK